MEEAESRHDVHVYTGPGVPKVFEDAFAVEDDNGRLKVYRWSTRREKKNHAVAGYAPGMWASYHHVGEQGDEVAEPPRPAQPRRVRAPQDVADHTEAPKATWTPDGPAEREAEIRSREPGAPENLQPAVERPALPPKDFAVPTHQLPRRAPLRNGDQTEVIPVVRPDQPQQDTGRPSMRRRTRGAWPRGTGAWALVAVAALSMLAAVH